MIVKLLIVLIVGGQHIEFISPVDFQNLEQCEAVAERFQSVGMNTPWAITCFVEHRA